MKRRLTTVIFILMIIAGLSLLLYPTVSNYIQSLGFRRAISDLQMELDEMDEETHNTMLEEARAYNARLAQKSTFLLQMSEEEMAEYNSMLSFNATGIMGYVSIPKIDVLLPIYHDTSEAVLQSGIGHLSSSSLPVGGENTHAVISGHRGLTSATLFTDIDQLVEGDSFSIRVLNEVLTYEVDRISVVLPYELSELQIIPGEDLCTLMTCTPYGVNTHRLLVRGHRIPTPEDDILLLDDGRTFGIDREIVILIVVILLVLLILTIRYVIGRRRYKPKHMRPKVKKTEATVPLEKDKE